MKKVKIGDHGHRTSFDKTFDEKENEILTPIISETIQVIPQQKNSPHKAFLIYHQSN